MSSSPATTAFLGSSASTRGSAAGWRKWTPALLSAMWPAPISRSCAKTTSRSKSSSGSGASAPSWRSSCVAVACRGRRASLASLPRNTSPTRWPEACKFTALKGAGLRLPSVPAFNKAILISGIGIAGPTLAFWLKAAGFEPTLIERAPALRTGGYVIDFWGLGYDIAERMDLVSEINRIGYHMQDMRIVNDAGRRLAGFGTRVFTELTAGRYVTLQ